MRKILRFLLVSTAAVTAAGASDTKRPGPYERERLQLEREMSRLTAGKPVECIDTRFNNVAVKSIDKKLIYRVSRNKIYVSDTTGGCEAVARGDVLVTRQFGSRLCRGDMATTVDRLSRFTTGSCAIGAFTPYTGG